MEELNNAFNEYIEEVKKMDISSKRDELLNSVKEIIAFFESLAQNENMELHYLVNRELIDLNGTNVSEDDFIEGLLVYVEIAKNIMGEYLEKKGF